MTPFNIHESPSLQSCLGLIRVSSRALEKYRQEQFRITQQDRDTYERMFEKITTHLLYGKRMNRKNAVEQHIKHGAPASYLVDGLWVMVVSEDNWLVDIYRKDTQQEINEVYKPFAK